MKDVQSTGDSAQKRTSSMHLKTIHIFSVTFLPTWIRIEIEPTKINADPDL